MDFWQKAKVFAEDAAKRSQEISEAAAKRSQELTKGAAKLFSQEFVTETAKKSKELAAEASKKADLIKVEALRRADQIKSLAGEIPIPIPTLVQGVPAAAAPPEQAAGRSDLEEFGVTNELREFLRGITLSTFRDFPVEDGPEISDVHMVSNVGQDLNEWQAKHATLILSSVKEISKFRYELCPRCLKERKFWRIYFVLVDSYVAPRYEYHYMESKVKAMLEEKDQKPGEISTAVSDSTPGERVMKSQSKPSTTEHDLDVFLLGDGSSDEGPDDFGDGFDDFDKM